VPKFRYVGPSALPVEIPAAGVVTDDKGLVEVPVDIAKGLEAQPDIWQPVAAGSKKENS
jgi:hypothetical protein